MAINVTALGTQQSKTGTITVPNISVNAGDVLILCVASDDTATDDIYLSGAGTNGFGLYFSQILRILNPSNVRATTYFSRVITSGSSHTLTINFTGAIAISIYKVTGISGTYNALYIDMTIKNITSTILGPSIKRAGLEYFIEAGAVENLRARIRKNGNPTGTLYARLRKVSDDSIVGTFGSIDVSTLSTSFSSVYSTAILNITEDGYYRATLEYDGGDSSNNVQIDTTYDHNIGRTGSFEYSSSAYTNSNSNRAIAIEEYKTYSPLDASSTGTGTGTSPSSGSSGVLAQSRELVIGVIGIEDNVEDIAGTWTTGSGNVSGNEQQDGTSSGGGASNIVIRSAAEVVNATTAQIAEITGTAGGDWAALVATFREVADATVALGTPTEGQDITDKTPDLVFTGTDPDSLDLEYQIQVDTSGSFGDLIADDSSNIETTFFTRSGDTHPFTSGSAVTYNLSCRQRCYYRPAEDTQSTLASSTSRIAQSFIGNGKVLESASLWLYKYGSPAANCTVRAYIYGHTGTYGSTSIPNATLYATSETIIYPSDLPASPTLTQFNFTGADAITLTNGNYYTVVFVITNHTADSGARFNLTSSGDTQRHSGNLSYYTSSWNIYSADLCFILETELSLDTYYWRARASDNSGLSWGTWSSIRSFDLVTSGSGGSVSVTPSAVTTVTSKVEPTVSYGSLSIEPAVAASSAAVVNPDVSVVLPSVLVEPTPSSTSASSISPTVEIGSGPVAIEPTPASAVGASLNPEVVLGYISETPSPAQAVALSLHQDTLLGSLAISPEPSASSSSTLIELVQLGYLAIGPEPCSSVTATTYQEVLLGSLALQPPVAEVIADVVNPTVSIPSSSIEPSPASSVASAISPTVNYGSLELVTSPAFVSSSVSLEVVLGPIVLAPQPASSAAQSISPTAIAGLVILSCQPVYCSAISLLQEVTLGSLELISPSANSGTAVVLSDIVHGSLSIPPGPAIATTSIVALDVICGSVDVLPEPVSSACVTLVEIGTSSLVIEPSPSYSSTESLMDSAIQGSLTLGPVAATSSSAALNPTVVFGNISIAVAAAQCPAQALPPLVGLGILSIEPVAVETVASSINPETHQGSLSFVVIVATSSSVVYPTVVLSSTSVADIVASAATSTINPDIPLGSTTVTPPPVTVSSISISPSVFSGNQFSRPYIDYTNIGWKNELDQSTNLYESINEITASDGDYIIATHGPTATYSKIGLQAIDDPEVHELHKMLFRYRIDGTPQYGFNVFLMQGDTVIKTWTTSSETSGYVDVEVPLTPEEVAVITDYSLLSVAFETEGEPI